MTHQKHALWQDWFFVRDHGLFSVEVLDGLNNLILLFY
jgi:hypothetical protein